MKPILCSAIAAAALLAAGTASAAPPENIARTTWSVQVNRNTTAVLVIETQAGPGAPGQATCRAINGHFNAVEVPVHGWYCPSTGRIHLLHNNLHSGVTVRVFTGNVSDEAIGEPLFMAGTVAIEAIAFGDLGETNFSAVQQL